MKLANLVVLFLLVAPLVALAEEPAPDPTPMPEKPGAAPGDEGPPPPPPATPPADPVVDRSARFLTTLTEVKDAFLGTLDFTAYFEGKKCGSVFFTVSREEMEGRAIYSIVFDSSLTIGTMTVKERLTALMNPDLSPLSLKAQGEQVSGDDTQNSTAEVTVGETVVMKVSGKDDEVTVDKPDRFISALVSFFFLGRFLDATKALAWRFNTVDYRGRKIMEWDAVTDGVPVMAPRVDATFQTGYLVRFKSLKTRREMTLWSDGKGGLLGFELGGLLFLPGKADELPAEVKGLAPPTPSPKVVTLNCFKGIYGADRDILEGIFDFAEFYKRKLGDPNPRKENLAKFKEALLKAVCRRNPEALKRLPAIAEKLVEEITGNEALVRYDGKPIAQLHKKGGKWLIYWIKP